MSDNNSQIKLSDNWQEDVLSFWFEELTPKQWYQSTKMIDNRIRKQFEPLIALLSNRSANSLKAEMTADIKANITADPRKLLAAIITLDQFPRNIYRGSPNAFAYDPLALDLAVYTVNEGVDSTMNQSERQFCYMPFMHAENEDAQNKSLELFKTLGVKGGIDSAIEHRNIVLQFGRFPHRNDVLERQSTEEEIQYLINAKRFGQ